MAGDWSSVGRVGGDIGIIQPDIGDTWVERDKVTARWPEGRVSITDVFPFVGKDEPPRPVERVAIVYQATGAREALSIVDLRKRFVFGRKA